MAKGDTLFESYTKIETKLNNLFEICKSKKYFKVCSIEVLANELATFIIELNRIHPFRE